MPTLSRKLDGSHYYIRAFIHAVGSIATYQVTAEGVAWLEALGIPTNRAGAQVSSQLLEALQGRGWAFTRGSGLHAAPVDPLLALLSSGPGRTQSGETAGQAAARGGDTGRVEAPVLAIETTNAWRLVLRCAELSPGMLPQGGIDAWTSLLAACRVRAVGAVSFADGLGMWPGSGGFSLPVFPGTQPYLLEFDGPWPLPVSDAWSTPVPALASRGTLFESPEQDGRRIASGTPIELGRHYSLVREVGAGSAPPAEFVPEPLGIVGAWEAFKLTAPDDTTPALQRFALELGHPVRAPRRTLRLVAPVPHRYTVQMQPVVSAGSPLLLVIDACAGRDVEQRRQALECVSVRGSVTALLPPVSATEPQHVVIPPLPSGSYLFRLVEDGSNTLAMRIEPRPLQRAAWSPPLLTVQLGSAAAHAFEPPVRVTVPSRTELHSLAISVETVATRLRLSLLGSVGYLRRREVALTDAPAVIREWMGKPMTTAEALLFIDAGSGLGRVRFLLQWPSREAHSTQKVAVRLRSWRHNIVPALVREGRIPPALGRAWSRPSLMERC